MSSNKRAKIPASTEQLSDVFYYESDETKVPKTVTHVVVSEQEVRRIEDRAFEKCAFLVQVNFPETLTEIGNNAFNYCTSLKEADLSKTSIIKIKRLTFCNCSSLVKVIFPESLREIRDCTFCECTSLSEVDLAKTSIIKIGQSAFWDCTSLVKVNFPESLREIGNNVFCGCTSLLEVDLSKTSIIKIEQYGFRNCDRLVKVFFPETLTEIGSDAFCECFSLLEADLSKTSVIKIGEGAFNNCSSLVKVTFPEKLTEIVREAFLYCTSLTVVDLSTTSLREIGEGAFDDCEALVSVHLPNSTQSIDGWAFNKCPTLSMIAIPDHVDVSTHNSFDECTTINRVKEQLESTSPSTAADYKFLRDQHRFANLPLHCTCYDPNLTLETLTTSIATAITQNSINNVDVFSMNALHVLCMNPHVSPCMISKLITTCPSLQTTRSIENMTPLMMFLRLKGLLPKDDDGNANTTTVERVSLRHCLFERQADWDTFEKILELDDKMKREMSMKDEHTGLYPFMEVAMNCSNGSLKALYNLVHSDPGVLFRN